MKFPDYYSYPAIFSREGNFWNVFFPDIENAFTSADSLAEAIIDAQSVLEDCMFFREEQNDEIPIPTPLENVLCPEGAFKQIVAAFMPPVRNSWNDEDINGKAI